MVWPRRDRDKTAIYQIGYSQFFNAYTIQCDKAGFIWGSRGPPMTRARRKDLNRLTHAVNYVLQYKIAVQNVQYTTGSDRPQFGGLGMITAIEYVDVDVGYNRHRFCREGVRELDFRNPNTWFFHLNIGKRQDPEVLEGKNDEEIANMAIEELNKYGDDVDAQRPLWMTKAFHPTPAGMLRTKEVILYPKLHARAAHRGLPASPIKIMVVGDYVPFGSQDPNSDVYQGFMRHLSALLSDRGLYGVPWGAPVPRADFIGSQRPNHNGAYAHECYQQVTVNGLHRRLRESQALGVRDKVVLIMAGTTDLFYGRDLVDVVRRLTVIIIDILDRDPTACVLLGHIPMMRRLRDDGSIWRPLNQRIVEYNAMLSALADQLFTQGWKVLKVHASATTLEHLDGDFIRPNTRAYIRLAYDFLQAIEFANLLEW
ncbi:carbohydrate esterase family 3 protein, partial [Trematosphaeria pertusa]